MKLSVLLYKDAQNPLGIPGHWPAQVLETDKAPNSDWLVMDRSEYDAYLQRHMADYLAWEEKSGVKRSIERELQPARKGNFGPIILAVQLLINVALLVLILKK